MFILAKLREALRPRLLHKVTHYYISSSYPCGASWWIKFANWCRVFHYSWVEKIVLISCVMGWLVHGSHNQANLFRQKLLKVFKGLINSLFCGNVHKCLWLTIHESEAHLKLVLEMRGIFHWNSFSILSWLFSTKSLLSINVT